MQQNWRVYANYGAAAAVSGMEMWGAWSSKYIWMTIPQNRQISGITENFQRSRHDRADGLAG